MERLKEIVGPAPSELTPEEFVKRLQVERARVRVAIQWFREGHSWKHQRRKTTAKKPTKKQTRTALSAVCDELGMTPAEVLAQLKAKEGK